MMIMKWVVTALIVSFSIAIVVAPIGPMPGLLISGAATEVPSVWGDTKSIEEIQLQMAGNLYELKATPLVDGQVNVLAAWQAKYVGFNPDLAEQFQPPVKALSTAVVYKLAKRA